MNSVLKKNIFFNILAKNSIIKSNKHHWEHFYNIKKYSWNVDVKAESEGQILYCFLKQLNKTMKTVMDPTVLAQTSDKG